MWDYLPEVITYEHLPYFIINNNSKLPWTTTPKWRKPYVKNVWTFSLSSPGKKAIESIRWGLVVMLPLWSDPSAPVEQINLFNSDYVLGYWPAQRKSTGVNNGPYCVPIELLQDYKHGARESWRWKWIDGGKSFSPLLGRHREDRCGHFTNPWTDLCH